MSSSSDCCDTQMQRGSLDQAVSTFGFRLSTTVVTSMYEAATRTVVNRKLLREYADDTIAILDCARHNHHNHHPCLCLDNDAVAYCDGHHRYLCRCRDNDASVRRRKMGLPIHRRSAAVTAALRQYGLQDGDVVATAGIDLVKASAGKPSWLDISVPVADVTEIAAEVFVDEKYAPLAKEAIKHTKRFVEMKAVGPVAAVGGFVADTACDMTKNEYVCDMNGCIKVGLDVEVAAQCTTVKRLTVRINSQTMITQANRAAAQCRRNPAKTETTVVCTKGLVFKMKTKTAERCTF